MSEGTSPWVYIGLGCLVAVVLAVGSCVGLVWFGAKQMEQMVEDFEDPEKRADRVAEILGMDEAPEGYYPAIAFSVPFVMEMAILSDRPMEEIEPESELEELEAASEDEGSDEEAAEADVSDRDFDFDQRGFIYINSKTFGNDLDDMRAFLRGEMTRHDAFDNFKFGVTIDDEDEIVARGDFATESADYLWAANRGRIDHDDRSTPGIETLILVECGTDTRLRMGIWMGPDPAPDDAVEDLDLSGTNADPVEIEAFMSHFALCS